MAGSRRRLNSPTRSRRSSGRGCRSVSSPSRSSEPQASRHEEALPWEAKGGLLPYSPEAPRGMEMPRAIPRRYAFRPAECFRAYYRSWGRGGFVSTIWLPKNRRLGDRGRLSVSALLRQPGGFEGLLPVEVARKAHDLAVTEGPNVEAMRLDVGIATAHTPGVVNRGDNVFLVGVDQLFDLDVEVLERLVVRAHSSVRGVDPSDDSDVRYVEVRQVHLIVRVEELPNRLDGTGNPVVHPPHDLHVLLRHRLLLHPDGFEGFGAVGVLIDSRDLALAHRIDLVVAGIHLDPAYSAASLVMRDHDDLIPGVDDFFERHLEFFQGARPPLHVVAHRMRAIRQFLIDPFARRIHHDIGIKDRLRFGATADPVVFVGERLAHDLHVLLRHRLLRQPDGFEGFVSLLEHPKASDLPVLDRVHERARRGHF